MANYILNMPRLTVTITKLQADWLEEKAKADGKKVSAIVREAIELMMAQ